MEEEVINLREDGLGDIGGDGEEVKLYKFKVLMNEILK